MAEGIYPEIFNMKHAATSDNKDGVSAQIAREKVIAYLREHHFEKFLTVTDDAEARNKIIEEIQEYLVENGMRIQGYNLEESVKIITDDLLDYGLLTDLILDPMIEEIQVNEYNDIRIVINGIVYQYDKKFDSPEQLYTIAEKMCRNSGAENIIKKDCPFVRLRMGNNIRISIMVNPVARRSDDNTRPTIQMAIRKHSGKPLTKEFLLNNGTIDDYGYRLLVTFLRGKASMIFYGGTNSGKTAVMTSIVHNIDSSTRAITIAEVDEMNLRKTDSEGRSNNVVMWETKPSVGVDMRAAVNAALTFTPETIIPEEIKGAETVDVIECALTGHQVLITLHAKNKNVLHERMLGMYKQSGSDLSDKLILGMVGNAFDLAIRMKIYADGQRRIAEIVEIIRYDKSTGVFETNVLVEFVVLDTVEEEVYDNHIKRTLKRKIVNGKHVARNGISEGLKKELLENGISCRELEELETMRCQKGEA